MPEFDPRREAAITNVSKKGDFYVVKGVSAGRSVSVDIPAPTVEGRSRDSAEALMRRSIYGEARTNRER